TTIELNRCAGSAEGPPSERIWVVQAQPLRQENPMAAMSPLRRRMIEDMTVHNLSPTTQRSYVHAVAKFSAYFGKSPDRLDVEDVRAYEVHLASKGVAWASLNQVVCALRFFYGVTLGRPEMPERIAYAREPRKLPVVLCVEEVVRFLEAVPGLKSRVALTTAYAAGLRVSEVIALQISDIDSKRMVIRIRARQGRQGALCHAVGAASADPTRLLATGPPASVAVPRPRPVASDRSAGPSRRLSIGQTSGRACQARHGARASTQLCHPSVGERCRHPRDPGPSRPQQPVDHGPLHPCVDRHHPKDDEPAGPPRSADSPAGLSGGRAPRARGGGHLPPSWRGLPARPWRRHGPCRAPRDERHCDMPDRRSGGPCRAVHGL